MMNFKELKEMVDLMNENGLAELEVERDGMKIKLKKAADNTLTMQPVSYAVPSIPAVSRPSVEAPAVAAVKPAEPSKDHLKEVKSPMVGTFYRASSPEAAPFIEIGQTLEVGQVDVGAQLV